MSAATFRLAAATWFRDHRATLQRADEIDYIARFTADKAAKAAPPVLRHGVRLLVLARLRSKVSPLETARREMGAARANGVRSILK